MPAAGFIMTLSRVGIKYCFWVFFKLAFSSGVSPGVPLLNLGGHWNRWVCRQHWSTRATNSGWKL